MKGIIRFVSYAVVTITCLVSSLGIVSAGPVKAPESAAVKASDPVYLLPSNVQMGQHNLQPVDHYSHYSHESHYSHQSHYSSSY